VVLNCWVKKPDTLHAPTGDASAQLIHDGHGIRVSLRSSGETKVMITFESWRRGRNDFRQLQHAKWVSRHGWAELRVQTRYNDWYLNSDFLVALKAIEGVAGSFSEISCFGLSMGGFAAILIGSMIGVERVLAISPQFCAGTSSEAVVCDPCLTAAVRPPSLECLLPSRSRASNGVVLYDPKIARDAIHAELIRSHFPQYLFVALAGGGHPATKLLVTDEGFGSVASMACGGQEAVEDLSRRHQEAVFVRQRFSLSL
jgi:hypothetical protein